MTEQKKPLFALLAALAVKDDASPLHKHPGCWERKINEQWWIAVNGHRFPVKCSRGQAVEPFNCYVEFNGWPAGSFDPFGGFIAAGDAANEEAFAAAIAAEIVRS